MSTKLTYQQLGNTIRMVSVKDVAIDKDIFDAMTSPNNGVFHGALAATEGNSLPTKATTTRAFVSPSGTSTSSGNTVLSAGVVNTSAIAMGAASGLYGNVTIDGITFYGRRQTAYRAVIKSYAGSVLTSITTSAFKLTIIKYDSASGEIVTSTQVLSSLNQSITTTSTSGHIYVQINIQKADNDLLLFVGIENIFAE